MNRVIFHIDVNNAFLSWSAVYLLKQGYKDIREIPSIIGGDETKRRGIVLAKSPPAKRYKIETAETIYSAKQKCKNLEVYPPNYKWYSEKSKELMNYLSKYSPVLEQLSIDECFLDMTGMKYIYKDLIKLAYEIKENIKNNFGYTVNIGIANNKLCAKMASDFEKPDKVHTLFNDEIETKLWPLPVGDLYMCGKKTKEKLNHLGIYTIKDLAKAEKKQLEKIFNKQGIYLHNAAWGIDESSVEKKESKNRSISTTETLPYNYTDKIELKKILFKQVEDITRQLRNKGLYTKTIGIIYKNSNFITNSYQITLDNATNNTKEILNKIIELFENSYNGEEIRLIGVKLSSLTKDNIKQITIFEEKSSETTDNIQNILDKINNEFNKNIIKPASLKMLEEKEERLSKK